MREPISKTGRYGEVVSTPASNNHHIAKKEDKNEKNERLPVQLKLAVGAANSPMEREADAMADKVMRKPAEPFIQRCSCGSYDDDHVRLKPLPGQVSPFIQAKGEGGGPVSNSVANRIQSNVGGGNEMPGETRSFMENRFGADFSGVKVHHGNEAAELSQELNAKAFTIGNDVFFNKGQFQPETDSGKHLLAHELTHVIQQGKDINAKLIQTKPKKAPAKPKVKENPNGTGCCYSGDVSTTKEIHLNLTLGAVRIFTRDAATGAVTNVEFGSLITGPKTGTKVRCKMYSIQGKQKLSGKGLINFVNYDGDFGFHSNFWKKKDGIERIPGEHSHGCARLNDKDDSSVHSDQSKKFYDSVSEGDCVRVYRSSGWETPAFKPCNSKVINCPVAAPPQQTGQTGAKADDSKPHPDS